MPRVLLIEDDPRVAKPTVRVLEKAGATRVDWVPSHDTAIVQSDQASYDILVSDFDLGPSQPTGVELLAELRALHPDAMCVCISGSPRPVPTWVEFVNKMDIVADMATVFRRWAASA